MTNQEIEEVLANWIAQANDRSGCFPAETDPAKWIATQFLRWWQPKVSDEIADAQLDVARAVQQLEEHWGWSNPQLAEVRHELAHAKESLEDLALSLGLEDQ
jgi:hypothetical protein